MKYIYIYSLDFIISTYFLFTVIFFNYSLLPKYGSKYYCYNTILLSGLRPVDHKINYRFRRIVGFKYFLFV